MLLTAKNPQRVLKPRILVGFERSKQASHSQEPAEGTETVMLTIMLSSRLPSHSQEPAEGTETNTGHGSAAQYHPSHSQEPAEGTETARRWTIGA